MNKCRKLKNSYQVMEIALVVHWLLASQQLQQNNAIAVDIRLFVETGSAGVLRINVANSAHDIG